MILLCSKCGKEISSNAKFCPYCGEEVVFNRNNPDAREMSVEENEKEQIERERPIAQEIKPQEPRLSYSDSLIRQYKQEIEICRKKRKTQVTAGIIIAAISLIAVIVLFALAMARGYELGLEHAGETDVNVYALMEGDYLLSVYLTFISLAGVLLDIGAVLIIVGAVVNSVKIKNRNKIIEEYERNKRL